MSKFVLRVCGVCGVCMFLQGGGENHGGLCSGGDTARVRKFYSTIYKIHTLTVMCGSDFNYKVIASHFLS